MAIESVDVLLVEDDEDNSSLRPFLQAVRRGKPPFIARKQ